MIHVSCENILKLNAIKIRLQCDAEILARRFEIFRCLINIDLHVNAKEIVDNVLLGVIRHVPKLQAYGKSDILSN